MIRQSIVKMLFTFWGKSFHADVGSFHAAKKPLMHQRVVWDIAKYSLAVLSKLKLAGI
jgi:hypothetical protein